MATALITGGTSGIGADFARSLAARGYDIVLVARDAARLATMAAELPTAVEIISADLGNRDDVARVAARIEDAERPIDILVNNAGFGVHTSLLARDITPFDRAFEVMVRSVIVLGGAAARAMRARGSGRIVNISSTAGFITMGAYSAIKGFVTSYSEGLSNELRTTDVTVTAVCPGWVRTEFHERAGIRTTSIPNFLWVDSSWLVEKSLRDVFRGKVVSISSIRYRVLIWFARHAPKSGVRWVSAAISSGRSEEPDEAHSASASDKGKL